jgi:hypothetical protein
MNIKRYRALIAVCTVFAMALLLANRPAGNRWIRVTEAEETDGVTLPTTKTVPSPKRFSYHAAAAGGVVTPAVPEPDKEALSIIVAEIQGPRSAHLEHIGRLVGPGLTGCLAPYRQAIEDVLPLMASLQARGDTLRYAQVANSVIAVWEEMQSICLEAVQHESIRERLEDLYGEPVLLARQ